MGRNVKNLSDAQQMFKILDKNGDGLISQEEMRSCGSRFNATEIEAIFAIGDTNNDGEIDISEFVAVMCPAASTVVGRLSKSYKNLEEIKQGFKKLDRDGDGMISKKEMASAGLSEQEVVAIFALGDSNNDGEIDLDEFIGVMCPSAAAVVFKVSQTFKGKDGAVKAFKQIDLDGDGAISKDEMAKANIGGVKLSKTEIDAIFQLGDVDKDGAIDLEEFLAVMVPSAGFSVTSMSSSSSSSFKRTSSSSFSCTKTTSSSISSSVSSASFCSVGMTFGSVSDAKAAFRRFDINNDGVMDPAEMKAMMDSASGKKMSDAEVMTLFKKGDLDGDGQIDMQEFIKLMFPTCADSLTKLQRSFSNLNEVKAAFRKFDADSDGHITRPELKGVMAKFGDADVDAVFALGDADQSGGIDYIEFIGLMIPNSGTMLKKISSQFADEKAVINGFKRIDANKDGAVSKQELKNGLRLSDQDTEVVFALGDVDQDGEISLPEFVRLMCPAAQSGLNKFRNSFRNIHEVISAFKRFDADGDGEITFQELKSGASSVAKFSEGELAAVFAVGDIDNDGKISFCEFARMVLPSTDEKISVIKKTLGSANEISAAFKKFDANNDGAISVQELKNGLKSTGVKFSDQEIEVIFAVADLNGDAEISEAEFDNLMGTAVSFGRVEDVKAAFFRFDKNGDGAIDRSELKQMLSATGKNPSDQEVDQLFRKGDTDGDGQIDLQEFVFLMFPAATTTINKLQRSFKNLSEVKSAFRKYDVDGDGHITRNELRQVMSKFTDAEVDQVFAIGDMDKSGGIDYQEFVSMMVPNSVATIKKLSANFKSVSDIKAAFKRFDADGDGQITRNEMKNGMRCSDSELDVIYALGDLDGDGEISVGEFI